MAALRHALEASDAAALAGFYTEDAEMVIVDANTTPSHPMRLTGNLAISAFWRDVCSREMTHKISHELIGTDRASLIEECAYPDGCHVMAAVSLDLRDGRIARHIAVQAWDGAQT